jgi:hypothetical protein
MASFFTFQSEEEKKIFEQAVQKSKEEKSPRKEAWFSRNLLDQQQAIRDSRNLKGTVFEFLYNIKNPNAAFLIFDLNKNINEEEKNKNNFNINLQLFIDGKLIFENLRKL